MNRVITARVRPILNQAMKLNPGDLVLVRLDRVNPREDQIKVSLA